MMTARDAATGPVQLNEVLFLLLNMMILSSES